MGSGYLWYKWLPPTSCNLSYYCHPFMIHIPTQTMITTLFLTLLFLPYHSQRGFYCIFHCIAAIFNLRLLNRYDFLSLTLHPPPPPHIGTDSFCCFCKPLVTGSMGMTSTSRQCGPTDTEGKLTPDLLSRMPQSIY